MAHSGPGKPGLFCFSPAGGSLVKKKMLVIRVPVIEEKREPITVAVQILPSPDPEPITLTVETRMESAAASARVRSANARAKRKGQQ